MSASDDYFKEQSVVMSIIVCHESIIKIEVENQYSKDSSVLNAMLNKFICERKRIADKFMEELDHNKKGGLIQLFSKYNQQIIELIGLKTL